LGAEQAQTNPPCGAALMLASALSVLALPQPDKVQHKTLSANGAKEFKSALLLMDRSLMNFVNNPVFRERNVVEVNLATQATKDLDDVIVYSANLKKIAANLKRSKANH